MSDLPTTVLANIIGNSICRRKQDAIADNKLSSASFNCHHKKEIICLNETQTSQNIIFLLTNDLQRYKNAW